MKVTILAGGVGTRLVEETEIKPTPMVEIGDKKLVEHPWQVTVISRGDREYPDFRGAADPRLLPVRPRRHESRPTPGTDRPQQPRRAGAPIDERQRP